MSLNDFSYTLHTQLCSLATTIATPSLTLNILFGELFSNAAILRFCHHYDCGIIVWFSEETDLSQYEALFSLRNWYTNTFPLTRERHRWNSSQALLAPRRSRAGRPSPPALTLHSPGRVRWVSFPEIPCSSQLGSFNSFKGTQLPSLFQCCSHTCEFLLEHAWQPHQKHFDFVGGYLGVQLLHV